MVFRNIVTVALHLKELNWTENFLADHQHRIIPDYKEKEDIFILCKALLLFEQKNFEASLDALNQLKYQNIHTKLNERRLRLKIYYELGLDTLFEDLINSFRKFISQNKTKVQETFIQYNRNFINLINLINKLLSTEEEKAKGVYREIQGETLLAEKKWLLEKLQEKHTNIAVSFS